MTKWTFGISDDLVLSEPDPEDGERREFRVWFCTATDKDGHRLRSRAQWDDFDAAEWVADNTQEIADAGLEDVAECPAWVKWWPVYGSSAHDENELIAWERDQDER